jgi:hypothetical protein
MNILYEMLVFLAVICSLFIYLTIIFDKKMRKKDLVNKKKVDKTI